MSEKENVQRGLAPSGGFGGTTKPKWQTKIQAVLALGGTMSDRDIADKIGRPVWRTQTCLQGLMRAGKVTKLTKPYEKPALYKYNMPKWATVPPNLKNQPPQNHEETHSPVNPLGLAV